MKVIFLDIDGVLCTSNYWITHNTIMKALGMDLKDAKAQATYNDEFGHIFCPVATKNFAWVAEVTNAKIVISSTWRMSGLRAMQTMWEMRDLPGEVIDVTPRLNSPRGEEIAEWLRENQVDSYVIIDDDSDMLPEQAPYFVKTDTRAGLTYQDAVKCIEILNTNP